MRSEAQIIHGDRQEDTKEDFWVLLNGRCVEILVQRGAELRCWMKSGFFPVFMFVSSSI